MGRVMSWEYDDKEFKFATKDLDKSSFKRGSHIPIKVRKVFECEDIKFGEKKYICLIFEGQCFNAYIENVKKVRKLAYQDKEVYSSEIRMNWNEIIPMMKNIFENEINDFEDSDELKSIVPKLRFIKQTPIKYEIEISTKYNNKFIAHVDKFVEDMDKLGVDILHKEIQGIKEVGEVVERVVLARKNQDKFRNALLKNEDCCKICGLGIKEILVASHIKPWSESSPEEKLDPNNGFLLCANHDALFDKHLITFSHEGRIIISERLSECDKKLLGLEDNIIIKVSDVNKFYLKSHRETFYKKEGKLSFNDNLPVKSKEIDDYKNEPKKQL